MKFRVEIPGAPPSGNHAHRDVIIQRMGRSIRTKAKTEEATNYQMDVKYIVQSQKPSGFRPEGQVRISYDFYLRRDIDCDNMIKIINDAIAWAINVNDRMFLPCVNSKTVGPQVVPRVILEIEG